MHGTPIPRSDCQAVHYLAPDAAAATLDAATTAERDILAQVNERVAAQPDLTALVDFVFDSTATLWPCDRLSVALLEDELRLVSWYSRAAYQPLRLDRGFSGDLHGSSLAPMLASGAVRLIDDLPAYLAAHPASAASRLLVDEGVRSSMTCPLVVDGRPVGVLFRSSRQPRAYTPHHAALHLAVASRLAQAVEKAWRIERLGAALAAYDEMLGFVSHELKSPLASIVSTTELLLGGYVGPLTDPQRQKLGRVVERAEQLLALIKEYLDLARVEGGGLRLEPRPGVDLLAEVLVPALDLIAPQVEQQRSQLVRDWPPGPVDLHADPELLRIVANNLLSNAVKYGREQGRIDVHVTADERAVRVAVRNLGPGFPAEERGRLFKKFSRLATPELRRVKGSGVGLYTAWRIVALHGGHMDARAEPGQWAEFSFWVPRAGPPLTARGARSGRHGAGCARRRRPGYDPS